MINTVGHFIYQHSMHNQDYHSSFQLSFTRGRPDFIPVLCIKSAHYAQWNLSPALCTFPRPAKSKKNYFIGFYSCFCIFGLFPLLKSNPTWPLIQLCQIETVPTGQNQFDSVDEKYPGSEMITDELQSELRKKLFTISSDISKQLTQSLTNRCMVKAASWTLSCRFNLSNISKNSFLGTMFANDNHLEV